MKFEYQAVNVLDLEAGLESEGELLGKMAGEGWELVSVVPVANRHRFYFKRNLPPIPQPTGSGDFTYKGSML